MLCFGCTAQGWNSVDHKAIQSIKSALQQHKYKLSFSGGNLERERGGVTLSHESNGVFIKFSVTSG